MNILHCPFCGYVKPEVLADKFSVRCHACGATGPDFCTTDEQAVAGWNRRALVRGTNKYRVALKIARGMSEAVGQTDEDKVAALASKIADEIESASQS